jgi:hypothetical protein
MEMSVSRGKYVRSVRIDPSKRNSVQDASNNQQLPRTVGAAEPEFWVRRTRTPSRSGFATAADHAKNFHDEELHALLADFEWTRSPAPRP